MVAMIDVLTSESQESQGQCYRDFFVQRATFLSLLVQALGSASVSWTQDAFVSNPEFCGARSGSPGPHYLSP